MIQAYRDEHSFTAQGNTVIKHYSPVTINAATQYFKERSNLNPVYHTDKFRARDLVILHK